MSRPFVESVRDASRRRCPTRPSRRCRRRRDAKRIRTALFGRRRQMRSCVGRIRAHVPPNMEPATNDTRGTFFSRCRPSPPNDASDGGVRGAFSHFPPLPASKRSLHRRILAQSRTERGPLQRSLRHCHYVRP